MDLGAKERACERCRQRRVKCDKRRPGCERCEKIAQPCPGYNTERKFLDQGASIRRKFRERANKEASPSEFSNDTRQSPQIIQFKRPESVTSTESYQPPVSISSLNYIPPTVQDNPQIIPIINQFSPAFPNDLHPIPSNGSTPVPIQQPLPINKNNGLYDVPPFLENLTYDEEFFDLMPDVYYARHNNSCGFFPGVPPIISDIDQSSFGTYQPGDISSPDAHFSIASEIQRVTTPANQKIAEERENEVNYLVKNYTEVIGPWLDLYDIESYYSCNVPHRALTSSLLRCSIAALSAKQLGRVSNTDPNPVGAHKSILHFNAYSHRDWFYTAAGYYDKALSYLRIHLQALSSASTPNPEYQNAMVEENQGYGFLNSSNDGQPANNRRMSQWLSQQANADDMLAAVSMFALYESLDNYEAEWSHHLNGFQTLLEISMSPNPQQGESDDKNCQELKLSKGGVAAFWNFARADYSSAYISNSLCRLDTNNLTLWRAAGLDMKNQDEIYSQSLLETVVMGQRSKESLISRTIIWILLKTINFITRQNDVVMSEANSPLHHLQGFRNMMVSSPEKAGTDQPATWEELRKQLDTWFKTLPDTFKPYAKISHPGPILETGEESPSRFTEMFFSVAMCAAALSLYHFTQILLLLHRPSNSRNTADRVRMFRKVAEDTEFHARQICGIALGRPPVAVRIQMVQPLYLAGLCLESYEDRIVVLDLLKAIEIDTGYATGYRIRDLRSEWGWE